MAFISLVTCFLCSPQVHPKELNNGIINAAFMLLFKDLVKLFASYNDGIINLLGEFMIDTLIADFAYLLRLLNLKTKQCFLLLEKYFKMKKSDCKEALEIYKRFLTRVTKIGEFMKLAEVRNHCSMFIMMHVS